jgi:hypothetical protein
MHQRSAPYDELSTSTPTGSLALQRTNTAQNVAGGDLFWETCTKSWIAYVSFDANKFCKLRSHVSLPFVKTLHVDGISDDENEKNNLRRKV